MRRRTLLSGIAAVTGSVMASVAGSNTPRPAQAAPLACFEAGCDDWQALAYRIDHEILPIPDGSPVSFEELRAQGPNGMSEFRTPFPPVPVWNPPGKKVVGLQAGHWRFDQSPDELHNNRPNPGTSGGGKAEWQVNLDIAERAAKLIEAQGVTVEILDGTPPIRYRAHAFVSLHCDGDLSQQLRGFKPGSSSFSSTPQADALLVQALWEEYGAVTGLTPQPNQVSRRMTGYYAFNARRYQHAVAPGVPHAILEMAFLTNPQDRQYLFTQADSCALGVANSVMRFLSLPL